MKFKNIFTKEEDLTNLRQAASISTKILNELKTNVIEGNNAKEIDNLVDKLCKANNVIPAFKGVPSSYGPFPSAICISVNDEILHAIPKSSTIFKSGDIVKLDFGIIYKGFFTDHCVTVGVGKLTDDEQKLIQTAKLCVDTAVKQAIVGNTVNDISYALQTVAEMANLNYVTSYCGHGIGKSLHESPEVLSYWHPDFDIPLVEGMVLCIENQLTLGKSTLKLDKDKWTLKTVDGSKGAMFEHMIIVRKGSPEILTQTQE